MLITVCYQKLADWLCLPQNQIGRAYLETHLDLLTQENEQFLEMFIAAHNEKPAEQHYLRVKLDLLRDARRRGGTLEAVREAYVNVFGGLVLAAPGWFVKFEQQCLLAPPTGWTERSITLCKLRLREILLNAKNDVDLVPAMQAELHYQLASLFSNYAFGSLKDAARIAIEYYYASLRFYTADLYPIQHAKVLTALECVYRWDLGMGYQPGCN